MIYKFKENRVHRAYYGGKRIDKFGGKTVCEDSRNPEEWLASTVEAFNPDRPIKGEGLSICEDGKTFKEVLEADPTAILGQALAKKHDNKMSILVKLLDSAERLVIQCHPTIPFAKEHFNSDFGKTECWYFLDTEPGAGVYLGFKPGITKEKWVELFEKQDVDGMLQCLHRFEVKPGDLWFVNGGVPHAIGGGCFMIELQEPSDLMVIPERVTPSGVELADVKLHGGLGFDKMFDCFVFEGKSAEETTALYKRTAKFIPNSLSPIVDKSLTEKFSMSALMVDGEYSFDMGDKYCVAVVTEGEGSVKADSKEISLKKSDCFFISANSGNLNWKGDIKVILCVAEY